MRVPLGVVSRWLVHNRRLAEGYEFPVLRSRSELLKDLLSPPSPRRCSIRLRGTNAARCYWVLSAIGFGLRAGCSRTRRANFFEHLWDADRTFQIRVQEIDRAVAVYSPFWPASLCSKYSWTFSSVSFSTDFTQACKRFSIELVGTVEAKGLDLVASDVRSLGTDVFLLIGLPCHLLCRVNRTPDPPQASFHSLSF